MKDKKTKKGKPNKNYTWLHFVPLLNAKNQYMVFDVDYTEHNAKAFNSKEIAKRVEGTLEKVRETLRSLGLAGDQVDIVAHSMGGLVVRAYCENNVEACKNQIRKLITIDTPFQGTELVRLLAQVRDRENAFFHPLEKKLLNKLRTEGCKPDGSVCRPLGPAIDALIPGSEALTTLSALPIPTHPIIGLSTDGVWGHDLVIAALWYEGLSRIFHYVPDTSFPLDTGCGLRRRSSCVPFFGASRSDRIVPQESQTGSVFGSGQFDNISAVDHITVHGNPDVVLKVHELLDARLDDSSKFIPVLPRAP